MGRALLRCESSCTCKEQRIEAHLTQYPTLTPPPTPTLTLPLALALALALTPHPTLAPTLALTQRRTGPAQCTTSPSSCATSSTSEVLPRRAGSRFECWASPRAAGTSSRSARFLSPPAIAVRSGFTIICEACEEKEHIGHLVWANVTQCPPVSPLVTCAAKSAPRVAKAEQRRACGCPSAG